MRGRVMALYSVVFLGSTPIGAPLVGWIAEVAGPRAGLMVGGARRAAGGRRRRDRLRPCQARAGEASVRVIFTDAESSASAAPRNTPLIGGTSA